MQALALRHYSDRYLVNPTLLQWRDQFLASIAGPSFAERLFDHLPDVVFSIKDREGRYVSMSAACVERCGLHHKRDAIGKTADDLFPKHMAARYRQQDEKVFASGKAIVDNLDLTVFNDGSPGWCVSTKVPLFDAQQTMIGLAVISKDLIEPSRAGFIDANFAATVDYILECYPQHLLLEDLAERAGLSVPQFDRRMKRIFQISAGQFIIKTRIDAAAQLLRHSERSIAEIALNCGFCDQSALTRQFRQLTGLSPSQYRVWRG